MLGEPGGHLDGDEQAAGGLTQLIQPGKEGEDQLIQPGKEVDDHYCLQDGGSWDVGKQDCKKHVALEVSVGQGIRLVCRRTSSWR